MKRIAIVMRHGENEKQKYNDGPLTAEGVRVVWDSAFTIAGKLSLLPNDIHDPFRYNIAFLVSGSLRGLDTYRIVRLEMATRSHLLNSGLFQITTELIRTDFFSTPDEDTIWRGIKKDPTFDAATKELGADEALLRHQLPLIKGPADRVVSVAKARKEGIVLIINHAPHDRLIVEGLTGTRPTDALELGKFRIVEFE